MKPLPVIFLPRASDQEALIRGLYALGYQYGSRALILTGLLMRGVDGRARILRA